MAGAWNKRQEGQPWLRNGYRLERTLQATLSEKPVIQGHGVASTEDRGRKSLWQWEH